MKEHRSWQVAALLTVLALATLGQFFLFYQRQDQGLPVALILGAGLLAVSINRARTKKRGDRAQRRESALGPKPEHARRDRKRQWLLTIGRGITILGTLGLALAVSITAHQPAPDYRWHAILWLALMVHYPFLFLQGDERTRLRHWAQAHRSELVLVTAVTLLALLPRLIALGSIPWPLAEDEGAFGTQAAEVLSGERRNPFLTGYLEHPNLFFFIQAGGLKLVGLGPAGLRLPSALAGALLVIPVFALGYQWFGRWVALIGAILIATLHFPLHYSRLGLNNIVDPLLATTALALLTWGFRSHSRLAFSLVGLTLGLSQYFYSSSRLTLLLAGVYIILNWRGPSRGTDRQARHDFKIFLPILLAGFFIAFGPLLWTFVQTPDLYLRAAWRTDIFRSGWLSHTKNDTGRSTLDLLTSQLSHAALAFNYYEDRMVSRLYNPPGPLLDAASGILWLFGLAVAWRRRRNAGAATLLAWVAGVILLGGAFLQDPPTSPRLLFISPALALLVALGLSALIEAMTKIWPVLGPHIPILLVGTGILLAAINLFFYFGVYTPRHLYGTVNDEVATRVGRLLAENPDQATVYFAGAPRMFFTHHTIRFLGRNSAGQELQEPISPSKLTQQDRDAIFIFLPERQAAMEAIMRYLPGGNLQEFWAVKEEKPAFFVYRVTATK